MDPPPTPLIKRWHGDKSDNDFVNLIFCRDPTSEKLDLYESKMALLYNGDPEEFLFVCNFSMTLEASGTLETIAKVQYLRMVFHEKALRHFDALHADVESTNPLTMEAIIMELGA